MAAIVRDLQLLGQNADVHEENSFSSESGEDKLDGIPCGWCGNDHNCNILGWSRYYLGTTQGAWCVSNLSYCGC